MAATDPRPGVMGKFLSKIRGWLQVLLTVVTYLAGAYFAVGTILLAAAVPHRRTWEPWTVWFVLLLVSAVWVALSQTIQARLQARAAQRSADAQLRTQTRADLAVLCQRIVSAIVDACSDVAVNDLAACVWAVRGDDGFDEVARFYLPIDRPSGPVPWSKGKGVTGWAWKVGEDLFVDLRPLAEKLATDGADKFNALPEEERFGLSASELGRTRKYTGVGAIQLFSKVGQARLLGMLVLDYVGADGFACIAAAAESKRVTQLTGALGDALTEAGAKL